MLCFIFSLSQQLINWTFPFELQTFSFSMTFTNPRFQFEQNILKFLWKILNLGKLCEDQLVILLQFYHFSAKFLIEFKIFPVFEYQRLEAGILREYVFTGFHSLKLHHPIPTKKMRRIQVKPRFLKGHRIALHKCI